MNRILGRFPAAGFAVLGLLWPGGVWGQAPPSDTASTAASQVVSIRRGGEGRSFEGIGADPVHPERISIVAETLDSPQRQEISFELPEGVTASQCAVWRTTQGGAAFEQLADAPILHRRARLALEPRSLYSVTTTRGQRKGMAPPAPLAPFPFPYISHFSSQAAGQSPRYFADQCGAFEITPRSDGGGNCLRQVIVQPGRATIEASIDGQRVASVRDLAFTTGLAGLGGSYHPVEFDRVQVK